MSSMRNAVQRRNHKERAQPLERQKWGLLEKHKDYSLRAKDHNEKKKRLRILRQKASERNPDEFAFGMMSATTKNGVKLTQRGTENGGAGSLTMDVVKLLKTQDAGYLQTVLQQTRKERERLERDALMADAAASLDGGLDSKKNPKRKVFGEEAEETVELDGKQWDVVGPDSDMDEEMYSGSDSEEEEGEELSKEEKQLRKKKRHARQVMNRHLDMLRERENTLTTALERLQAQRAKMNNATGGVNKNGVKFKVRERKR